MATHFVSFRIAIVAVAAAMLLTGCTTIRTTDPQRSATEQLLISVAADHAAEALAVDIPKDKKLFIDASNFDGYDSKYAIGAIRDHILRQGVAITNDKNSADAICEIRSGALSVDDRSMLVGIPPVTVPVPLSGTATTPEIAFYKHEVQQGIAKFAATTYDAKTGVLISSSRPDPQSAYQKKTTLLFFITWTSDNLKRPED